MHVAAPLASSFVVWMLGLSSSIIALRKGRKHVRQRRFLWAGIFLGLAAAGCFGAMAIDVLGTSAQTWKIQTSNSEPDPSNEPIGEPKGCNPGRVAWVHDPDATDWDGPASGEPCWTPEHTNQMIVDTMMSRAVRWLAGESTDAEAWNTIFRHFNAERGNGVRGYEMGERVFIKINLTSCNASGRKNRETRVKTTYTDKASDTSPQMILSLLRQLVNVVGVSEADISIGDTVSFFPQQWYDYLSAEFPGVTYLDHYPFPDRTPVEHSTTPFFWSTSDANDNQRDYLPVSFVRADYVINFAVLKGHSAGITVCAKNHYGSLIRSPVGREWDSQKDYYDLHDSLPWGVRSPGRGRYRALVDLMGHDELGGKTVLYLIDGLYGGYYWEGTPHKWDTPPFSGDWPSSLFASQDPVAIDSVAYDFLKAEWPAVVEGGDPNLGGLQGGAQDYLHEAALANTPPSGTFYDPEMDGTAMDSLGVHEHWNNHEDKAYSRNLGTGDGIELISSEPGPNLAFEQGDLNGDEKVDVADALLVLQMLAPADLTSDAERKGDVNEDGKIGLEDVFYVLQRTSGLR
jgi:hypothetical protein